MEFNVVPQFYYVLIYILLVEKGDLSHKTNEIYIQQSTRLEPNNNAQKFTYYSFPNIPKFLPIIYILFS